MKNVSIVLAVYNEAETLEKEVRQIYETIISKIPGSEIIIAEDGSTDGSKEIIKELVEELGIIHSTSTKRKGYTRALRDAFKITKSPYIFFSDTGNKHSPEDFWKLYNYIDDFDLIIGVKSNRKDQNYRKALTWGYNKLLSIIFRKKISDADSGFRIYSKDLMDALTITQQRLINNKRDIGIYFEHKGNTIPYFGFGNRAEFLKLLPVEQAIYCIKNQI